MRCVRFTLDPDYQAAFWSEIAERSLSEVRHLIVDNDCENVLRLSPAFLSQFPKVTALEVDSSIAASYTRSSQYPPRWDVSHSPLEHVRHLRIVWCSLTTNDIVAVLRMPNLTTLSLDKCTSRPGDACSGKQAAYHLEQLKPSPITTLSLRKCGSLLTPAVLRALTETLHLTLAEEEESTFHLVKVHFPKLDNLEVDANNVLHFDGTARMIPSITRLTVKLEPWHWYTDGDGWLASPDATISLLRHANSLRHLTIEVGETYLRAFMHTFRELRSSRPSVQIVMKTGGLETDCERTELEWLGTAFEGA